LAKTTQLDKLRAAERKLASDLTALRAKIKAAERGENKRVKDANKYIARTLKMVEKTRAQQEQIQEKELAKLERFLGESFETLSEARSALVKQTAKPTKREKLAFLSVEKEHAEQAAKRAKAPEQKKRSLRRAAQIDLEITGRKLNPEKKSYKVRQLSEAESQSVLDFLTDKKTFSDAGLGYLKPNERITVSVPYRFYGPNGREHMGRAIGRKVFRNWAEFQAYLMSYISEDETEDWLGDIEIIKFPDLESYKIRRGKQTDIIIQRRKDVTALRKGREKKMKQKARASAEKKLAKEKEKNRQLKLKLKQKKGK
jgi:hypothetical protein